jgi:hypothetical protein
MTEKYQSRSNYLEDALKAMFSKEAPVITLESVSDPLRETELPKGSLVTVKDVALSRPSGWVLCEDENGILWNIRPKDLKIVESDPAKKGRYYILRENNKK